MNFRTRVSRVSRLRPAWSTVLFLAIAFVATPSGRSAQISKDSQQWTEIPRPETIEELLYVRLNEARTEKGLPRLRLSPDLVRLARTQSGDMAARNVLTHDSASGRSLKDRLDEAGILYAASGENVARSDSFLAELIHESFMNSPEHRDNILHPDFDEIGIGVCLSKNPGYFITVDFLKSLIPKSAEYVRSLLLDRLNEARKGAAAPALALIPEASEIAGAYSKARSAGREVQANADAVGAATVHFLIGPDLENIAAKLAGRASTSAPAGGLGSWFGRTAEYPGGAFYVCAILLNENPSLELRGAQMTEALLEAANGARRASGLKPLVLDPGMSGLAANFLKKAKPRFAPEGVWAAVYETRALSLFPDSIRAKLEDATYGRIGLAVVRDAERALAATYTVAVVLTE